MATQTVQAVDHELLAAGEWTATGEWGEVESPYDGTAVGRVALGDAALVDHCAIAARAAFESGDFPQHERAAVLDRAAGIIGERLDDLALTIAAEAGKPLKTARAEAERCADTLTFSAVEARKLSGGTVPMDASASGAGKLGVTMRVPYGVVGAISPFNFPLNLVAHKLGPAIAAGNAVVLKPAGQTPISALKLAAILLDAGRPRLGGRQRDRRARADRRAQLHRLGQGRLGYPQSRPTQEGQPRAGLQRTADRPLRRRLGDGGRQSQAARLLARRAELHLDPADPRT
jgi:delta 1-pyrroline-5-carboxylate dehydrogenase